MDVNEIYTEKGRAAQNAPYQQLSILNMHFDSSMTIIY